MAGTVLIFAFLLAYTAWVLLIDKDPVQEKLKLGQMVNDMYAANAEADNFAHYLEKSADYALVEAVQTTISSGKLIEGCEVLYESDACIFSLDKFAGGLSEESKNAFDKYIKAGGYEIAFTDYEFTTKIDGKNLVVEEKNAEIAITKRFFETSRKMSFRRPLSFERRLNFDFSHYIALFNELNENLACLKEAKDEQIQEDIGSNDADKVKPEECLDEKFMHVKKTGGILSFDYEIEGILLEDSFTGPMNIDLKGFEESRDIAIA